MRLGVDLHAIQAPSCRGRGIGRYAKSLLLALLHETRGWDFVFYYRADLLLDWDESQDTRFVEWVAVEPDPDDHVDGTLQQLVQRNPHGLDWLLELNPVVERRGFAIPEPVPHGPRLASVVYDFIPSLFPRHYLADPRVSHEYFRDLRRLQTYDLLLAISEATSRDTRRIFSVPERRIANIQAATDPELFRPPAPGSHEAEDDDLVLARHRITKPFLYYLGNVDWRKNTIGLIDVFALLPADLRRKHQLVLTCQNNAWYLEQLRGRIEHYGLEGSVVLTGPASDEAVLAFYRRAELFLCPSFYEGFGLPILEAMRCGAAVVAADNSSQPEVVGSAGLLAKTGDPADWAEKVTSLLRDPDRLAELRKAALEQASRFTWESSARRLRDAVEAASEVESAPVGRTPRGIVPYPSPARDGFDPRSSALFQQLCESWDPVVFFDAERAAELPPCPMQHSWHDKKVMARIGPIVGNPSLLYMVDSLHDLTTLLDDLRRFPGVVAFTNPGIASWRDFVQGQDSAEDLEPRLEFDLIQLVHLARGIACHSEWLYSNLNTYNHSDRAAPIHLVASPRAPGEAATAIDAEAVYARLLRAS
ncbi:glycosyltransferase family 4 protein [Singulisphaera sp. PoT]|uniref:glycosyltransferase family 4 protein n=1 Tax=Singulisphaera sp. PoT TaxID=3411797 RepID=UPI003BF55E53